MRARSSGCTSAPASPLLCQASRAHERAHTPPAPSIPTRSVPTIRAQGRAGRQPARQLAPSLVAFSTTADRARQKSVRGQLRRRFDFYISAFTAEAEGFTASDFDELVARGRIEITPSPGREIPQRGFDQAIWSDDQRPVKRRSSPGRARARARVVFCGMAVGPKSARVGSYHGQPGNQFWACSRESR